MGGGGGVHLKETIQILSNPMQRMTATMQVKHSCFKAGVSDALTAFETLAMHGFQVARSKLCVPFSTCSRVTVKTNAWAASLP